MTPQDGGNAQGPLSGLQWLERVGGIVAGIGVIATALAFVIGQLFPGNEAAAQTIGTAAATLLAGGSGAFFYFRWRRAQRFKVPQWRDPPGHTAALRGLLPFEQGDDLPGRKQDAQYLATLISNRDFRFGVLWGESGTGKTSLLRAGIVPLLRQKGLVAIDIPRPTSDPLAIIRDALARELAGSREARRQDVTLMINTLARQGKKVIILLDQFEEFFALNKSPAALASFVQWLGKTVADSDLPVAFLLAVRSDSFSQLQKLAPAIPEPTSPRTTYELANFTPEVAAQIFAAAAERDGVPFQPELINAVVADLETDGVIRPAELQIVGTRLKLKNILNLNRYEIAGRARGILSSYISEEIKQSPDEQLARLVLRLMTADVVESKAPVDLSLEDIEHRIGGVGLPTPTGTPIHSEQVERILKQFVGARILIQTDQGTYNLVHDYLAPYVRLATEGVETNAERANRLLKRYIAEYREEPRTRIPFGRLRLIEKYASAEAKSTPAAQALFHKSARVLQLQFAGLALLALFPALAFGALYMFDANSYYLGTVAMQTPSTPARVVVRQGYSGLKALPWFGQVVIETDSSANELDPKLGTALLEGQLSSLRFQTGEGGYAIWGDQLVNTLTPYAQARALSWLGEPDRAMNILTETLKVSVRAGERAQAVFALAPLIISDPRRLTPEIFNAAVNSVTVYGVADVLPFLGKANPELITPGVITALAEQVVGKRTEITLGVDIAYGMGALAQLKPDAVPSKLIEQLVASIVQTTPATMMDGVQTARVLAYFAPLKKGGLSQPQVATLMRFAQDPDAEYNTRNEVVNVLVQYATANPEGTSDDLVELLNRIVTHPTYDGFAKTAAGRALARIGAVRPQVVTAQVINAVADIVFDPVLNYSFREPAAATLGELVRINPGGLRSDLIGSFTKIIADPEQSADYQVDLAYALGAIAPSHPEIDTAQLIREVIAIVTNPAASYRLEADYPLAMQQLAKANPSIVTSELVAPLYGIITAGENAPAIRVNAARAAGALARVKPDAVQAPSQVIQSLLAFMSDPAFSLASQQTEGTALSALLAANHQALTLEQIRSLFERLKTDQDRAARYLAANQLFVIYVSRADHAPFIEAEASKLAASSSPHWRIAANRLNEMIAVGKLIPVARSDSAQGDSIRQTLEALEYLNEDHLQFAAKLALDEIASAVSTR